MKKIIKRITIGITLSIVIFMFINLIGAPIIFNILFDRYTSPDYDITPGLVNYNEVSDEYEREEIVFKSLGNDLVGYYYENNSDTTIVMSHGINDTADSLLSVALFFIDNGYNVFSYDSSGCGKSSGKVLGFTQSLIDLESALSYLNSTIEFKNDKKLLFGFSWGAFASATVLGLDIENVYGSVSVSGYNDSEEIVVSKGESFVGPLVYTGAPFVYLVQNSRFGKYVDYKAIDSINSTNIPVYLAHGKKDNVIRYNEDSIIGQVDNFDNPNVEKYISNEDGHTSILYSDEAIIYQNEVLNSLNDLSYNEKKEYVKAVDDEKYSELNSELFNNILSFYSDCLGGY